MNNQRSHCKPLSALMVLLPILVTACGAQMQGPECPLVVGIITSETGNHQVGGLEHIRGYEIALEEINAAGGILSCSLELIVKDDTSVPQQAQWAVKELVEENRVPVIIGAYSSGATIPASGVANVYQVPFVVPTASTDLITNQGYEWVFRVNAPGSAYASAALDFVQEELGSTATLAIVYESSLFGESAAVAVATDAAARDIKVVAYEKYKPGLTDHALLLSRVKSVNPDVLYFASNNVKEAVVLMQQAEALDLNPKLYIGHAGGFVIPEFLTAGRHAEYVIATAQWATDVNWPGAAEFTQKFTDRYGTAPGMRSAQTYTTLYVVKDAIERAAKDESLDWQNVQKVRLAVRDALEDTDIEETIFGPIRFDRTGQNAHPVVLVQVIDGRFVAVYPKAYKARDPVVPVPSWAER